MKKSMNFNQDNRNADIQIWANGQSMPSSSHHQKRRNKIQIQNVGFSRGQNDLMALNRSNEMDQKSYNKRSSLNDYNAIVMQENMTSAYNTNDSKTNMLSGIILTQGSLERLSNMRDKPIQKTPTKEKPLSEMQRFGVCSNNNENEIIDNLKQNQYLIKSNFQNNLGLKKKSRRHDAESLNTSLIKSSTKPTKMNSDYMNSTFSNFMNEEPQTKQTPVPDASKQIDKQDGVIYYQSQKK